MNSTIKQLLDNNYYCFTQMFLLGSLQSTIDKLGSDRGTNTKQRVISDQFKSYYDINKFLSDTYVKWVIPEILRNFRDGTDELYFEENGNLYINPSLIGGRGYCVDWGNYSFTYTDVDLTTKKVTIFLSKLSSPEINAEKTPLSITANIKLEYGKWKLEKMIL